MSGLQLPLDYERLPEYRRLVNSLRTLAVAATAPIMAELAASFLWHRLWVELALLARSTNQAGWLPEGERALYEATVGDLFGDDQTPVGLLVGCGLLREETGGWHCELFARLNPHHAGDYQSKEMRGALHSALVRNEKRLAAESLAQTMLLPEEIFRDQSGAPLNETEAQRAINLIKTLDNCFKLPGRAAGGFTAGLVADAAAILATYSAAQIKSVYLLVMEKRESRVFPKSSEKILSDFAAYVQLATPPDGQA